MKTFTMNTDNLKDVAQVAQSHPLEAEPDGLLFSPAIRAGIATRLGPGNALQKETVIALLTAVKALHQSRHRWCETHGLSEGRFELMSRLMMADPDSGLALGDLAELLDVSPRNVTGLIDNLERDGLVARVPDPTDRRSVRAELTPAGRERMKAVAEDVSSQATPAFAGFQTDELRHLRSLCLRLMKNLKEKGESHAP